MKTSISPAIVLGASLVAIASLASPAVAFEAPNSSAAVAAVAESTAASSAALDLPVVTDVRSGVNRLERAARAKGSELPRSIYPQERGSLSTDAAVRSVSKP